MNEDIYKIVDEKLKVTGVVGVSDDFVSSFYDAITIYFEHLYLHMEADDEDDSLIYRVGEAGDPLANLSRFTDPDTQVRDLSQQAHWAQVISKPVRWFWQLQNHKGYLDGVQLEFAGEKAKHDKTLQFLGMASSVEVSFVQRTIDYSPHDASESQPG